MKVLTALVLLLVLAGLVVAVGVVAWVNSPAQQDAIRLQATAQQEAVRQQTAIQAQRAAADLQASQQSAARWSAVWDAVTPLAWLVLAVLALCVVFGAPAALGIALAVRWDTRQAQRGRLQPVQGQVSVSVAHADQAALMGTAGYWQAQIEQAKRPAFSGQARNERLTITNGAPSQALPNRPPVELPAPPPALALPGAVDLAQVLTAPPTLDRILVGMTMQGPVYVAARQLVHVGLLGRTGAGKSSTLRMIMSQLLGAGADCLLCDPHYASVDVDDALMGDWRPIEARLLAPPAVSPSEIRDLLGWMDAELKQRLELRRDGQPVGRPVFICSDEWPAAVDDVPELVESFTRLLRQGRKVKLYGILSTQSALVKALGDATLRDSLATCFYGGGDKTGAAALLDLPRREIDDASLGKGVVLLKSAATPAPVLARLPLASNESLARLLPAPAAVVVEPAPPRRPSLAELINPPRPPLTVLPGGGGGKPEAEPDGQNEPQSSAADTTTTTTTTAYDPDSDRRRRVLELHEQGISKSSICQVIWGYKDTRVMGIVNQVLADRQPDQAADG